MKSMRFNGVGHCEEVTREQLTLLDRNCNRRLRISLDFNEIGYLAEKLHEMIKKNQERLDDAKRALRGNL